MFLKLSQKIAYIDNLGETVLTISPRYFFEQLQFNQMPQLSIGLMEYTLYLGIRPFSLLTYASRRAIRFGVAGCVR